MSERKETTLADICTDISYGYTESARLAKVGPKFLRITDIANGRINWENVPYCPISKNDFIKYKLLPGDILIARTGATTGANYTVKDGDPSDLVFASYLIRYKIDKRVADPNFIGFILQSSNWKDYVDAIAGGSAQPGANAKQLGSFEFMLPKLSEQTAIASILSSLDNKLDLLHRQNATLEKMAETLFRQWFVEEVKEEWEENILGDVTEIRAGGDKPKIYSAVKNVESQVPIYSNGIDRDGLYGFTNTAKIYKECITISARGTIGFVCLRQEPFVPIVRLISIVPNEEYLSSKYLYLWAKTQDIFGTGTTQEQLTVPDFSRTKIVLPPKSKMVEFTNYVNILFEKKAFNKTQIHTLTAMRDTLLPKLMSGEVRVEM